MTETPPVQTEFELDPSERLQNELDDALTELVQLKSNVEEWKEKLMDVRYKLIMLEQYEVEEGHSRPARNGDWVLWGDVKDIAAEIKVK